MNNSNILVMYLRISVEDRNTIVEKKEESNSITNQRNLLKDYIEKNRELSKYFVTEICDDGYSGTNLERPGIKRVLEMAKKQKIGCVMVKDFSRFGRDYLMVGDYIDQIFPFLGIRFISVIDHYDSAVCKGITSGMDMAFRNLLYHYYSYDLSLKIKTAMRTKAENGDFLSPFAPLGYQKMPENKNQLMIEPEGAAIVRKIFALAGRGMGVGYITRWLNQEHIPTPCQIKNKQGKSHPWWEGGGKEKIWEESVVRDILRDERYLGKNIYGKRERVKVGDYHVHMTSPKDWIIVKDCHDPIISSKEFAAARKSVQEYVKRGRGVTAAHLFYGKIRCETCGHSLKYRKTANPYYCCITWKNTGKIPCIKGKLRESDLTEAVLSVIQLYTKIFLGEKIRQKKSEKISALQRQFARMQGEGRKFQEQKAVWYEQFADGKIDEEEFRKRQELIARKQDKLQQEYDTLQKKLLYLKDIAAGKVQEKGEDFLGVGKLTRGMVEMLIDSISVYPNGAVYLKWKFGEVLVR